MKKTVFVIAALAVTACGTTALAQGPGGPPPAGGPAGAPGLLRAGFGSCPVMGIAPPPAAIVDRAEALQLTDDQKTKLRHALANGEQTLTPLRQKAAEASRALRQAIFAAEFDAQSVQQLATDAMKAETAVLNAEIAVWTQIRGILTSEQVAKLQDLVGRGMAPGMGGGRRGGPGSPPGGPPPAE